LPVFSLFRGTGLFNLQRFIVVFNNSIQEIVCKFEGNIGPNSSFPNSRVLFLLGSAKAEERQSHFITSESVFKARNRLSNSKVPNKNRYAVTV
jgi:hypothetical protein